VICILRHIIVQWKVLVTCWSNWAFCPRLQKWFHQRSHGRENNDFLVAARMPTWWLLADEDVEARRSYCNPCHYRLHHALPYAEVKCRNFLLWWYVVTVHYFLHWFHDNCSGVWPYSLHMCMHSAFMCLCVFPASSISFFPWLPSHHSHPQMNKTNSPTIFVLSI
jgi:hypothetical protein